MLQVKMLARGAVLRADGRVQGLSTELGAFVAGVMLSATEQQENALHQLEHLKQFFLSLFISSTGLIMSPMFLAQHLRVLAGGLIVTVFAKTVLVRQAAPSAMLVVAFWSYTNSAYHE
jgi:Kef-type K+ transport system membrane component KefB